jgi:hypothetical protein
VQVGQSFCGIILLSQEFAFEQNLLLPDVGSAHVSPPFPELPERIGHVHVLRHSHLRCALVSAAGAAAETAG